MRTARVWAALMALLGVLGSGSAARAADLYVAGQIGISSGEGDATSRVDFGPEDRLYARLLAAIDEVLELQRRADERAARTA